MREIYGKEISIKLFSLWGSHKYPKSTKNKLIDYTKTKKYVTKIK